MFTRKFSAILCLVLSAVLLTACTAAKGSVKVRQGNALSKTVELTSLPTEPVQGVTLNADGDQIDVDTTGILISSVLQAGDIDASWIGEVSVQARDKTTVEVTGSELNMANKAFLTPQEDGSWDLVVLGEDDGCILKDVVFLHAQNI